MQHHALINGIAADCVALDDRGLAYGDGVFDTLKLQAGRLCYWPQHFQRLQQSADRLGISLAERQAFEQDIKQLLQQSRLRDAVIKIIVTRGSGRRGYAWDNNLVPRRIVSIAPLPPFDPQHASQGIRATLCRHRLASQPQLAGIKHLNRLDNVLARSELGKGIQEGIVCNQQGLVIEGCSSNVFFFREGQLCTPALRDAGVDGIIRRQLLSLAASPAVHIGDFSVQALQQADEIFFCNSLIGLWPVRQLDDKLFDSIEQSRKLAATLTQHEQRHATIL